VRESAFVASSTDLVIDRPPPPPRPRPSGSHRNYCDYRDIPGGLCSWSTRSGLRPTHLRAVIREADLSLYTRESKAVAESRSLRKRIRVSSNRTGDNPFTIPTIASEKFFKAPRFSESRKGSEMNCAYQYSHNGHPQNVMTIAPTAPQQGLHPVQETEYLEVGEMSICIVSL